MVGLSHAGPRSTGNLYLPLDATPAHGFAEKMHFAAMTESDVGELVVVVDEHDRTLGIAPKLDVHEAGTLHRAVSVIITDGDGRVLLQQRAAEKYHSPGLWTNTCCGHPRPGEVTIEAAKRRLLDEMGLVCRLEAAGSFRYHAMLDAGMIEHELDHVFVGRSRARPNPDPLEVQAWRWEHATLVERGLAVHPALYTAWFAQAFAVARRHPLLSGTALGTRG